MRAIFINGPMDGRIEEIQAPPPHSLFVVSLNDEPLRETELTPYFKQVEYRRTISDDKSLVYVESSTLGEWVDG